MRLSAVLLILSLAGVLGGAWLIGLPAFGGAMIFDSLALGAWALARDDGTGPRASVRDPHEAPTLHQVLQRSQNAP